MSPLHSLLLSNPAILGAVTAALCEHPAAGESAEGGAEAADTSQEQQACSQRHPRTPAASWLVPQAARRKASPRVFSLTRASDSRLFKRDKCLLQCSQQCG